jgi:hypothetical protein
VETENASCRIQAAYRRLTVVSRLDKRAAASSLCSGLGLANTLRQRFGSPLAGQANISSKFGKTFWRVEPRRALPHLNLVFFHRCDDVDDHGMPCRFPTEEPFLVQVQQLTLYGLVSQLGLAQKVRFRQMPVVPRRFGRRVPPHGPLGKTGSSFTSRAFGMSSRAAAARAPALSPASLLASACPAAE